MCTIKVIIMAFSRGKGMLSISLDWPRREWSCTKTKQKSETISGKLNKISSQTIDLFLKYQIYIFVLRIKKTSTALIFWLMWLYFSMVPDRFQKIFRGVVQIWQKLLLTMENEDQIYRKKFWFGLVLEKICFLFEKMENPSVRVNNRIEINQKNCNKLGAFAPMAVSSCKSRWVNKLPSLLHVSDFTPVAHPELDRLHFWQRLFSYAWAVGPTGVWVVRNCVHLCGVTH